MTLSDDLAGLWYFPSASGTPAPAPYPDNPDLKGGGVFAFWGQVQTGPSTYSWTLLDSLVHAWTDAGKPWNVRFNGYTASTGYAGSPGSTPMWLMDSAGPIYNLSAVTALGGGNYGNGGLAGVAPTGPAYDGTTSGGVRYCIDLHGTILPCIWDAAYIAGLSNFAQAVATRYAGLGIPPAWIQTGVGHAGETYLSADVTGNPCAWITAAPSSTTSTLSAGPYYIKVLPLYGTGASGHPPQMTESFGALEVTTNIKDSQSIVVHWSAPAVTTPAPLTITGYAIGMSTTGPGHQAYWNTVDASTFTYTLSNHGNAYTTDQTSAAKGLQDRMWDLMGLSGDQTLMGNANFTASSTYATFFPTVAAALAAGQANAFPSVPAMALTVANPSGTVENAVDAACLAAAPNLYIQNDGLVPNSANHAPGLITSLAKGFAVYEERAQITVESDLLAEIMTSLRAGVQVVIVFAGECDAMILGSTHYTAAWTTAGHASNQALKNNALGRYLGSDGARKRMQTVFTGS